MSEMKLKTRPDFTPPKVPKGNRKKFSRNVKKVEKVEKVEVENVIDSKTAKQTIIKRSSLKLKTKPVYTPPKIPKGNVENVKKCIKVAF